ncbi:MAG: competence/damage-inducible protein A [Nitrospirae bacterium]|nr:MAG: competence/damage-inducible protein A [Nitrospirota bacterium]
MPITAELIAIGSELLWGEQVETNSIFLGKCLREHGIDVRFKGVVGDQINDIASAIKQAIRRATLIVLTGGLGPTQDDVTREAIASVIGQPLRRRNQAIRLIEKKTTTRPLTPPLLRQALVPIGAQLLENPQGIAPGFCTWWKSRLIIALPGVPHEAHTMFQTSLEWVLQHYGLPQGQEIPSKHFHTFGITESHVDAIIRSLRPSPSIRIGLQASPLGVTISLTPHLSRVHDLKKFQVQLEIFSEKIRSRFAASLYAEDNQHMEEIVGAALQSRQLTLAIAESCTGGLLGHRLTQIPGSSAYFDRGVICYSNRAKTELLGVSPSILRTYGAVSPVVAKAMAQGIRSRSQVDLGLSITGIAGPTGGSAHKPIGLVYVGLATPHNRTVVKEFRFHGDRNAIKLRASQGALDILRRWLHGLPLED